MNEREAVAALEAELQRLRSLLREPGAADELSKALAAKLAAKPSARDRLKAAQVAGVLLELGDAPRAGALFQRLLEVDPDEPYYRVGRGNAHLRLGELEAAARRFDEALAVDAALAEAYLGRGEARLRLDRAREALEDFEKVVELDPESTFAQLALVLLGQAGR